MVTVIVCSILGIILLIGIIRVMSNPTNTWVDFILEILLLDLLIDLLGVILKVLAEALSDTLHKW